jgi:hypothetical protein
VRPVRGGPEQSECSGDQEKALIISNKANSDCRRRCDDGHDKGGATMWWDLLGITVLHGASLMVRRKE